MRSHIKPIWPEVIGVLLASGFTHNGLARAIGTQQSTISRLYAGKVGDPGFVIGAALIDLAGGADALMSQHGLDVRSYVSSRSASARDLATTAGVVAATAA